MAQGTSDTPTASLVERLRKRGDQETRWYSPATGELLIEAATALETAERERAEFVGELAEAFQDATGMAAMIEFKPTHRHQRGGELCEILGYAILQRNGSRDIPVVVYRHCDGVIHVVKYERKFIPLTQQVNRE